jgi:hypothetical protein
MLDADCGGEWPLHYSLGDRMGDYDVEMHEVENAGFYGKVFYTDDLGQRNEIGQTPVSGMKPTTVERAQEIARLHKKSQSPEVIELDV